MKEGFYFMKKDAVLDEIKKDLNWKERIILTIFAKTYIKIYHITRILEFNQNIYKMKKTFNLAFEVVSNISEVFLNFLKIDLFW